jgi:hypothetical protein
MYAAVQDGWGGRFRMARHASSVKRLDMGWWNS